MPIIETIKLALAALWANRLRSALTLLGVIIGVASVITIISAIQGLMGSIENSVNAMGPATFVVTKFGIVTSHDQFMDMLKRKDMTLHDMRAIEKGCPDCALVGAQAGNEASVKRSGKGLRSVPTYGTTPNIVDMSDMEIGEGRYFVQTEYDHNSQVAFVGPTIVEELLEGEDPIGKMITIRGSKFRIIGVAKKRGAVLGNNQDNFVMIPLTRFVSLFGRHRESIDILVKASSVEMLSETQDEVRSILRARRGVPYNKDDDFTILTADNILAFIDSITRGIRVALVGISSIALVVGGIVIMNIMMVSVTERTREIGIRKSLGARRKHILMQFLFEALILSLGGGIIGTAVGIVTAIILGSQISLPVSPSALAIVAGLSISTGVGVFFGLYPAVKASKLDPIEALRFE